ncbi:FAD-binding protein [Planktomarina sp.]|uniref:FAD-binding protein n=1 Tax=Planktomarina sp. TaxID=2024851 RepID=UPI0032600E8D
MGKPMSKSVIVVGTGNAALCAALAALETVLVLLLEKADKSLSGGNTKYTAGAMRLPMMALTIYCRCCATQRIRG